LSFYGDSIVIIMSYAVLNTVLLCFSDTGYCAPMFQWHGGGTKFVPCTRSPNTVATPLARIKYF